MAISVNEIIQNAFQRCSLVGDGESATGTQSLCGLQDLQSLISELNTENDVLENYETFDVRPLYKNNRIKFAIKPNRWFEYEKLDDVDVDGLEYGDIIRVQNDPIQFYTVVDQMGAKNLISSPSWVEQMKEMWADVWVEELPDRTIGTARKIANRFVQLEPVDKMKIDSTTKTHLPTMYSCENETKIVYPMSNAVEGFEPYHVEYFIIEFDTNVSTDYRITVLKGIPKYKMTDTIHLSSKYESLLEDGLCVKLCQRYKLMDIKADFEKDFEKQKYKIQRINYANRPMTYSWSNQQTWDRDFSNFAGGVGWGV